MIKRFVINTSKKQEIVDITDEVKQIVEESDVKDGICLVYLPHATAGIIVNENYDALVCEDILNKLEELVPGSGNYQHDKIDNNANAHIKSSLIGSSQTFIIQDKKLILGTWQGIAIAEFDGPRKRTVLIKIIKE